MLGFNLPVRYQLGKDIMPKINPHASWLPLEAAWRNQPTERRSTLVKAVRDHIADGDLVLTCAQLVTLWPGDADGKLVGEDIYFGESPLVGAQRVTRGDLPDYFVI